MPRMNRSARKAMDALKGGDHLTGNTVEEAITDLLTDLRHLCDAKKLNFADLDRIAYDHYTGEPKCSAIQRMGKAILDLKKGI